MIETILYKSLKPVIKKELIAKYNMLKYLIDNANLNLKYL